jgi:hypothetical protein
MDARKAASPKGATPGSSSVRKAAPPAASGRSGVRPAATPALKTQPSIKGSLPRAGRVKTGNYKSSPVNRSAAALIDVFLAALPGAAFFWAAGKAGLFLFALLQIAYLLLRDGLGIAALDFSSIGKKILGLHVEREDTGESKVDLVTSVKRNLPLIPGLVLLPFLWGVNGALALALAALPPVVELVMVITDPNGIRLGDRIAGTKVLD